MRRKPRSEIEAFLVFPIFRWILCDLCKEEFRLEWGWGSSEGTSLLHVCRQCAVPSAVTWQSIRLALAWLRERIKLA